MGWFVSSDLRWGVVGGWPRSSRAVPCCTLSLHPREGCTCSQSCWGDICPLKPPFGELLICGKISYLVLLHSCKSLVITESFLISVSSLLFNPCPAVLNKFLTRALGKVPKESTPVVGLQTCGRRLGFVMQEGIWCSPDHKEQGSIAPVCRMELWPTPGVSEGPCVRTCVSCVTSSGN